MNLHALNRRQRVAVAASAVTALGVAIGTPMQAAAAAATPTASAVVSGQTLLVTGTNGPDDVEIGAGTDPGTLLVDLGQNTTPMVVDRATFSSIAVFLGNGDDTFSGTDRNGDVTEPLFVDGGNGNDTITGGAGNDTLFGGNGNDTVLGGAGNDITVGDNGNDTVDGGRGTDTESLGNGDDIAAWVPGEGNDIIDGGPGHDTLAFTGSSGNEKFDVSANGTRALLTRDLGGIRMDMVGVEALNLAALGGADQITLHDLHQTDLRQAAIDLSVAGTGDVAADTVVLEGSDGPDHVDVNADGTAVKVSGLAVSTRITGSEGFDQLHINTGAGNDTVHVADALAKRIGVAVDLGSGQTP